MRVLVVEDDRAIAEQLIKGLTQAGHDTELVRTGAAALAAGPADIVLLDLGLPDLDGVFVCSELHERTRVPVIILTARGEEGERVRALDAGADDYLVKPFGFAELLARIRAVTRRAQPLIDEQVVVGPLGVDLAGRRVTIDGAEVPLTGKEFDILACLVTEPGRVVSREEIFDRVWDANWYGPTKVLDVHLSALRRKLGVAGLIETVHGRGFRVTRT